MEILKELEDVGIQIPEHTQAPFSIPQGYFDQFSSQIIEQLHRESFLESLPKVNPYSIDSDYFENLPETLVNRNYLDSLPKETTYELPPNYFQHLPDQIIQKAKQGRNIHPMRKVSPIFASISIAASIVMILSISFLFLRAPSSLNTEQKLAMISKSELELYINNNPQEFSDELTYATLDETEVDLNSLEEDVFKQIPLSDLSKEEINQYAF